MRDFDLLSIVFAMIVGFVLGFMAATPAHHSHVPTHQQPIDQLPMMGQE
jgi:hypothetical protein